MLRIACAILILALLADARGALAAGGFVPTDPPRPVPPFVFEDEKGQTHDLKEFRGRTVLLNLWATWCGPCGEEMPALNDLGKKLDGKRFAILAVAEDRDGLEAARAFFQRHSIDRLAVYADPGFEAPSILHAEGLPTTLLIDANGLEIARLEGGADWTQGDLRDYVEKRAR